jgi:hypothetical protein
MPCGVTSTSQSMIPMTLGTTPPACIQAGETNQDEAMVSIDSTQLFSALRKIFVALRGGDL